MKHLIMLGISLSVFTGGLMLHITGTNNNPVSHSYWFKKSRKEILRYESCNQPLSRAVGNSLHFILSGLPEKILHF